MDEVFLVAFGTGFRNRSSLSNVFAGAQPNFVGLDQTNILIPSSLAGTGNANTVLSVVGRSANVVTINVQ